MGANMNIKIELEKTMLLSINERLSYSGKNYM